jgi:hypothetical protein
MILEILNSFADTLPISGKPLGTKQEKTMTKRTNSSGKPNLPNILKPPEFAKTAWSV